MMYKGNLATRFNIFARRNTKSEDYKKPLNELADSELKRDIARAEGRVKDAAIADKEMNDVMEKYTSVNALGIQTSIFNKRKEVVRFISDRVDDTIKHIAMAVTVATGTVLSIGKLKEFEAAQKFNATEHSNVVDKYNNMANGINDVKTSANNIIDPELAQKVADGQVTQVANMGETAALHTTGSTSNPNYLFEDGITNQDVVNAASNVKLSGKTPGELFKGLAENLRNENIPAAQRLENAAKAAQGNTWKVDHGTQLDFQSRVTEQNEAQATVYENIAELMEKINNFPAVQTVSDNFKLVKQAFVGPIISALGAGLGIGHDISKNKQEKEHNQAVDINRDDSDR